MKELSIFVDESGDFGRVDNSSPYYLVTLVFHSQADDISAQLVKLNKELKENDCPEYIHTGPIILRETPYQNMTIDERRSLLYKMRMFFLHLPISHTTIKINRREANDKFALTAQISKKLKAYITEHFGYFSSFDKVIVYYDNGQQELNIILKYRLLQTADYVCSIELLSVKYEEKRLSKTEQAFFYKPQELKKTFIKSVRSKELK